MAQTAEEKRDPIKLRPLRNPGQSLEEEIDDFVNERPMAWFVVVILSIVYVGMEWMRWMVGDELRPFAYSLCGVAVILFAVWRIRVAFAEVQNLKTGLKGERHVGQFLQNEGLPRGYTVIHDICEEDFNIDHALIGPGGVFAIETKTRFKRKGESRVEYDGQKVLVDGFAPDRDPVVQSKAGASRLQQILFEYSGKKVAVRPVVLFPGWFVSKQPRGCEVWVLNEKGFIGFLDHEPEKLSREEIAQLGMALGRYVRDCDEKKSRR